MYLTTIKNCSQYMHIYPDSPLQRHHMSFVFPVRARCPDHGAVFTSPHPPTLHPSPYPIPVPKPVALAFSDSSLHPHQHSKPHSPLPHATFQDLQSPCSPFPRFYFRSSYDPPSETHLSPPTRPIQMQSHLCELQNQDPMRVIVQVTSREKAASSYARSVKRDRADAPPGISLEASSQ